MALRELVCTQDMPIYERAEDGWGTVHVRRVTRNGKMVVSKVYTGRLSGQAQLEVQSLLQIAQRELSWTLPLAYLEMNRVQESGEILTPYVGLDLYKWERLLRRDPKRNPFQRVEFQLNLAAACLRALKEFHQFEHNSFVHCDLKMNNICIAPTSSRFEQREKGKSRVAGVFDLSKLMLIDLGSAFTVPSQARQLPESPDRRGMFLSVAGPYVAGSYTAATDQYKRDKDSASLASISWKADLYSLGVMFEELWTAYSSSLEPQDAGHEFLEGLPGRLKSFEFDASHPVEDLPHADIIRDIHKLVKEQHEERFSIPLEAAESKEVSEWVRLKGQGESGSSLGSAPTNGGKSPGPVPSPIAKVVVAALAVLGIAAIAATAVWVGIRPSAPEAPGQRAAKPSLAAPRSPAPAPLPTAVTRSDPLFRGCDSLRQESMQANAPIPAPRYAQAVEACSALLSAQGMESSIRFDALMTRSVALEKLGRFSSALDDLRAAEALDPGQHGVDLNRALVLYRHGNREQAIASLEAARRKGWTDLATLERDRDFAELVSDSRFRAFRLRSSVSKEYEKLP